MSSSQALEVAPPPGAETRPSVFEGRYIPLGLSDACSHFVDSEWTLPTTPAFSKMVRACKESKRAYLEVTIAHFWLARRNLLAVGYHMICYDGPGKNPVKIAAKDWDDDAEVGGIESSSEARYEALRQAMARILPIAAAMGSPHIRFKTEDTSTSAVIKPIRGYRVPIPAKQRKTAYSTRRMLIEYKGYPERIFSRGCRKDERNAQSTNGKPTPYQRRFGPVKSRLRHLVDPDGRLREQLWVDLVKVGDLVDKVYHAGARRPSFTQALLYQLRDVQGLSPRVISEMTGIPTGQVNRGAATFADRLAAAPEVKYPGLQVDER